MNDDISKQLHLAARDNRRAAMAIEALERAQEDANRANEALKSAQDQAKVVQHAAVQSLAELKAMMASADAETEVAPMLRVDIVKCEGREPMAVIISDRAVITGTRLVDIGAKLCQLVTKGRTPEAE